MACIRKAVNKTTTQANRGGFLLRWDHRRAVIRALLRPARAVLLDKLALRAAILVGLGRSEHSPPANESRGQACNKHTSEHGWMRTCGFRQSKSGKPAAYTPSRYVGKGPEDGYRSVVPCRDDVDFSAGFKGRNATRTMLSTGGPIGCVSLRSREHMTSAERPTPRRTRRWEWLLLYAVVGVSLLWAASSGWRALQPSWHRGEVPIDREMITAVELARARQLEPVFSHHIPVEASQEAP